MSLTFTYPLKYVNGPGKLETGVRGPGSPDKQGAPETVPGIPFPFKGCVLYNS